MPGPAQSNNQQPYLIFLEILIIIVGLVWGIWQPMKTLRVLSSDIKQKKSALEKVKSEEDQLIILKRDFNKYQEKIDLLQVAMPSQPNVADTLVALEAIGSQAGATITELTPTSESKDGKIIFDYNVQSSFEGAKQIISLLNNNLRPIKIIGITLGATTSATEEPINLTFQLEMPYLADIGATLNNSPNSPAPAEPSISADEVSDETNVIGL